MINLKLDWLHILDPTKCVDTNLAVVVNPTKRVDKNYI